MVLSRFWELQEGHDLRARTRRRQNGICGAAGLITCRHRRCPGAAVLSSAA